MYKWCLVPGCTNSTIETPKKLFVSVPKKPMMRKMWLKLARRNPDGIRDYSTVFFCEDHFNLPYDMLNYTKYKIMGTVKRVLMKPGCLPSRFDCHPDRKRRLPSTTISRNLPLKRRQAELIEDAESAFQTLKESFNNLGTTIDKSVRLEMKAFTVLLCVGTLSLVSSAPINQKSQHSQPRTEYDYEYESSKPNQASDPEESASHYDAYIQDVQSAATGGNNAKKGFSRGSGLRTIAVGSANQAKTALGNQQAAGFQAAYVAKNTLAQSAAQSSATAQAALAGKQVILSGLEQQVRDAKVGLQGEEMQLQQAKRSAQAAAQAAQQAMHQVNVIQAALNAAQATSENANEAASQAAGELGAQTAMVGAARQRLQTLQEQLKGVRIDFEATQAAARKAQAAAQQAQANAAEAAAKAAAAGLGGHDASHEGTSHEEYKSAPDTQQYYQADYQH